MEDFLYTFQSDMIGIFHKILNQQFNSLLIFAGIIGCLELLRTVSKNNFGLTLVTRIVELLIIYYLFTVLMNKINSLNYIF